MQTNKHPFNGPFSGTNRVSQYQKGKTKLDCQISAHSTTPASPHSLAVTHQHDCSLHSIVITMSVCLSAASVSHVDVYLLASSHTVGGVAQW